MSSGTAGIVLITGANKGIGLETARQLGERGLTVLVGSRDAGRGRVAVEELQGEGADARFVQLDVTDEQSIVRAAKWIESEFGHLDVLINNAGIWVEGMTPPEQVDVRRLRETYEVNVFGVVATTHALLPLIRRSASPRIVNVSTELSSLTLTADPSHHVSTMRLLAYNSSKAALNSLTLMYANALKESGILVNAAYPGFIATDLNGHRGFQSVEDGARVLVHLATLPADGPTGQFLEAAEGEPGAVSVVPW
ncbi:SDR family oxidoreductase [Streptomyces sp. NPDC048483]|uniref:SDR family oxidoreductase n=1 Tax=Streptomyces sp. NPDC048483 TaxID=3154927 RepID=UPI003435947D